jgi:glucose/arabinose dehydrogenase
MKKGLFLTLSSLGAVGLLAVLTFLLAATAPTAALSPAESTGSSVVRSAPDASASAAPLQITDTFTVIASNLDNPRGLTFAPNGDLYVTEAGKGGAGPCFMGPEGGEVCYGTSGAVTRVSNGTQERIVTGLSSVAANDGSNAGGPHDVSMGPDGTIYVLMGLGGNPSILGPTGTLQMADDLGQLITVTESGNWGSVVNVSGYEASNNPDGGEIDTNPFDLVTQSDGSHLVADAGGNDLLHINASGTISTLAVFATRLITFPPGGSTMIPMQAVPTAVTVGSDGAYYVGQLTGFPFPPGGANVYRVVPGQITPTVFMTGFTNIVDLAFGADGSLYVLEMAANGLLSGDPTGAIVRVTPGGSRQIVASEGLTAPVALTVGPDHALYVSNMAIFAGAGQVVRVPTPMSENGIFLPFINKNLSAQP